MNGCRRCCFWLICFTECCDPGSPANGDVKSKKKSAKNHLARPPSKHARIPRICSGSQSMIADQFRRRHRASRQLSDSAAREFRDRAHLDRKSTRLNSSHITISYAVFCLKKKKKKKIKNKILKQYYI